MLKAIVSFIVAAAVAFLVVFAVVYLPCVHTPTFLCERSPHQESPGAMFILWFAITCVLWYLPSAYRID